MDWWQLFQNAVEKGEEEKSLFQFKVTTHFEKCQGKLNTVVKVLDMTNAVEKPAFNLISRISTIELLLNAVKSRNEITDKVNYIEAVNELGTVLSNETRLGISCNRPQFQSESEEFWSPIKLSVKIWYKINSQ